MSSRTLQQVSGRGLCLCGLFASDSIYSKGSGFLCFAPYVVRFSLRPACKRLCQEHAQQQAHIVGLSELCAHQRMWKRSSIKLHACACFHVGSPTMCYFANHNPAKHPGPCTCDCVLLKCMHENEHESPSQTRLHAYS
jgi:hypothetical protein